MTGEAAPHVHQGPFGTFTCTCCIPDASVEASVEAPTWWDRLFGRTEPEPEASP